MSFIDKCKLYVKAGNGGDGIVSWRREAHVPLGGPAGGNGGCGGSIYFIGDHNETSLEIFQYTKKIIAKNGENGGIKNMYGSNAEDLYIKVPLGTVVTNLKTNEIIADILVENKKYLIVEGGVGGHGNAYFKSGYNKAPTLYEKGEKGEELDLLLELKQIADIGIIGLPNAGKSTLLSKLTNANPKIANYQFTTLIPILGSLDYKNKKIILADIPGLIEGASDGVGLGFEFLKHIERCKILIHLVSLSCNEENNVIDNVNIILNELKKYNVNLADKEMIIVGNKCEEDIDDLNWNLLQNHFKNSLLCKISCLKNIGLNELKELIYNKYLKWESENINISVDNDIKTYSKKEAKDNKLSKEIKITKIKDHLYNVECEYLEYWSYRIPINTQDNLLRLNQKIKSTNLYEKLKEIGVNEKDTIKIYNIEWEYE